MQQDSFGLRMDTAMNSIGHSNEFQHVNDGIPMQFHMFEIRTAIGD
jgi:hypothetical protein